MTEREIKITLPEGQNKTALFETVAYANGYSKTVIVPKLIKFMGTEAEANIEVEKLRAKGVVINGANVIEGGFELISQEEVENISAFDEGKNIIVSLILGQYKESAKNLATQTLQEQVKQTEEAIEEQVANIGEVIVD